MSMEASRRQALRPKVYSHRLVFSQSKTTAEGLEKTRELGERTLAFKAVHGRERCRRLVKAVAVCFSLSPAGLNNNRRRYLSLAALMAAMDC